MTANDRFDDIVARWLLEAGPADIRPVAVELALERAAQLPQRRGLQSWLVGTPLQPSRTRVALLVALAALALAAAALVAGTLLRPSPLGGGGWINVSSSSTDIHILTADGALDRSFTRGHNSCPRLSPDGSEVAYNIRCIPSHAAFADAADAWERS